MNDFLFDPLIISIGILTCTVKYISVLIVPGLLISDDLVTEGI